MIDVDLHKIPLAAKHDTLVFSCVGVLCVFTAQYTVLQKGYSTSP